MHNYIFFVFKEIQGNCIVKSELYDFLSKLLLYDTKSNSYTACIMTQYDKSSLGIYSIPSDNGFIHNTYYFTV